MSDDPAYILDVSGLEETPPGETEESKRRRAWIGVNFECCGVYSRIYRNRERTAYVGFCPRCARRVQVRIGPTGTHHRMFRAW